MDPELRWLEKAKAVAFCGGFFESRRAVGEGNCIAAVRRGVTGAIAGGSVIRF
jgi:hypothetical protein